MYVVELRTEFITHQWHPYDLTAVSYSPAVSLKWPSLSIVSMVSVVNLPAP